MKSPLFLAPLAVLALSGCGDAKKPAEQASEAAPDAAAPAPDAKPGITVVDGVLTLPVVKGRPGAAYFTLTNGSDAAATLAAVTIEGAGKAEMHETRGGSMVPLGVVELKPGEVVKFARGGKHVMAFDLAETVTAGLLVALRVREPDASTLAACARAMRAHRMAVTTEVRPLVDTCGTGGDRSFTFNISTAAALVVAAAGGAVAKHGNRSVSSRAGSADVLEASGAVLTLGPREAARTLDATGFASDGGRHRSPGRGPLEPRALTDER